MSFKILQKKSNYSILNFCTNVEQLFSYLDDGQLVIEYILDKKFDEYINHQNKDIIDIIDNCYKYGSNELATLFIMMAEKGIINYVLPSISKDMLLCKKNDDEKSVIEWLLEYNKELAMTNIISKCEEKNDPDFVIVLKVLGIDDFDFDIKIPEVQFSREFIKQYNANYDNNCISPCEDMLIELQTLFYQDSISDKSLVDALIKSYRYLTSLGNDLFIMEVRQLIEIKKRYPDKFVYKKINTGAYFSPNKGSLFLSNDVINIINHETTHALHFYLSDSHVPNNYFEVIERARNNPQIIQRIWNFKQKYDNIMEISASKVPFQKIDDYFDSMYRGKKRIKLEKFLKLAKKQQKQRFQSDYSEDVLDVIMTKSYSVDKFIEQRKKIEELEVYEAILDNEYVAFFAIGDIIDAIFLGQLYNGVLKNTDGSYIQIDTGHGIDYYSDSENGFDEMIAEYGTIIKSKNNKEMLSYLRYIVGDEVVDMIEDVYINRVLGSEKFIKVEEENRNGK